MKKDRSNQSSSSRSSLGLPRESILRGRTNFQRLFDDNSAITYFATYIKIRFHLFKSEAKGCKIGFIVPKKLGKATKRNRVKRLLREAYRLNQHILTDSAESFSVCFHGVLIAKTIDIDFKTAEAEVTELLNRVKGYMHSNFKV